MLKKMGYRPLYKIHPKGIFKGEKLKIFGDLCEYVYEPFLEVLDKGDLFLFCNYSTATMEAIMLTDKPIVWIYDDVHQFVKDFFRLIKSRVTILSTRVDINNQIVIEEDKLQCAIHDSLLKADDKSFRNIFISQK